jgi:hypothetical protein
MAKHASRRKSRAQAREEFLEQAGQLWDEFNAWYQAHPEATFKEMELELRPLRRKLMGQTLELVLSQGGLGANPEAPTCDKCGRRMTFKGYPGKTVHGLEGDSRVHRAYYYCPACEAGLFPPGPPTEPSPGQME